MNCENKLMLRRIGQISLIFIGLTSVLVGGNYVGKKQQERVAEMKKDECHLIATFSDDGRQIIGYRGSDEAYLQFRQDNVCEAGKLTDAGNRSYLCIDKITGKPSYNLDLRCSDSLYKEALSYRN